MTPERWTSWHLHLATGAVSALDRVVSDVVVPAVDGLDHPWFFIRYWQQGPHVRLRVADLDGAQEDAVADRLRELMRRHAEPQTDESVVEPEAYLAEARRQAQAETGENRTVRPLLAPGVHPATYEPELERYGGPALMAASEALFCRSSALVVDLLADRPDLAPRRIAALRLTEAAARSLGPAEARAVFHEIGRRSWSAWARSYGYDASTVDAVASPASAPAARAFAGSPTWLSTWSADVETLTATLEGARVDVPGAIVSSHVHMTHNRLGLTILDELRTYALLARTFPAPPEAVPDLGPLIPA